MKKIKEITIFYGAKTTVAFIVGETVNKQGKETDVKVEKISVGIFRKKCTVYLSNGEVLRYFGFNFLVA